ncbi:sensor histidine kinase [uncultured Kordia sp.]|uniref:tetratricopeptide repeat-containing sensor histidine kinase n=1 Tax=uncultured Kordia sp. TaxID=507699 RepID=UPI002603D73E|nr:sensor histidine kinase [uncultured Kordia sp.]
MMKKILVLALILHGYFMAAQDDVETKIKTLKNTITTSEGIQKLVALDSLTSLVLNKTEYAYDSIAKVTIAYALKLDSVNIAVANTSSLIRYYAYSGNKTKEAITTFEEFTSKNIVQKEPSKLAKLYLNGANSYFFNGMIKKAISTYTEAENLALLNNDSTTYGQARAYKASAYSENGDQVTASKLLKETANLFTRKKDTTNLLESRMILSTVYGRVNFTKEAQEEMNEIIKIAKVSKKYGLLLSTMYNSSINYHELEQYDKRLAILKEAYRYITDLQLKNQRVAPLIKYSLLSAYTTADSLPQATKLYRAIEQEVTDEEALYFKENYLKAKADYFIFIGNYDEALKISKKLLSSRLKSKNVEGIYKAYEKLSVCYKELNDYENAYTYFTKYEALKDSVNTVQKVKALSYYQTLYETEKRDFKIASQQNEITVLDEKNKIKQQWIIFGSLGLLVTFIIIYLMRSQKFVKKQQVLQEQFSQDLIKGQEEERSRLARELHDSVGQKLMLLSKQTKKLENPNMENLASSTLEEIRTISRGLHPSNLERLGLTTAINALVYDINASTDLFFTEEIDNIDNILSKEAELHLYRIIQESLSNIVKHSEAKAVKMEIQKNESSIDILVSDNGKGFDFESKLKNLSLGLKTLFERAKILNAVLSLDGKKGEGTIMKLSIPIQN